MAVKNYSILKVLCYIYQASKILSLEFKKVNFWSHVRPINQKS